MSSPHNLSYALDQTAARAFHNQIRSDQFTNYERGLFYHSLLRERIWTTQSGLATDLGVSKALVSRLLSLARLPSDVVDALGGPKTVTFRTARVLQHAIDTFGKNVIVSRIHEAKEAGCSELDDLLQYAVEERLPERECKRLRVRIGGDKQSLRVEIGDLSKFAGNLAELEEWLTSSLAFFEARLEAKRRIAAHEASFERIYRSRQARAPR
jgi:hypothetical protein